MRRPVDGTASGGTGVAALDGAAFVIARVAGRGGVAAGVFFCACFAAASTATAQDFVSSRAMASISTPPIAQPMPQPEPQPFWVIFCWMFTNGVGVGDCWLLFVLMVFSPGRNYTTRGTG